MALKRKEDIEQENIEQEEIVTEKEIEKAKKYDDYKNYIYVGYDVGNIFRDTLFIGTKREVLDFFKDYIKDIPEIEECIIPVEELSEANNSLIFDEYRRRIKEKLEKKGGEKI